jgi:cell division protein FtsI/penicillin-binding protein 2
MQNYQRQMDVSGKVGNLNPLEIDDRALRTHNGWIVAYSLDGKPLHQNYKGGKLTKSLRRDIGRIDMVGALESSSNPYFSLLAGDFLEHPEDLARAARDFSYGARTGIDLPGEYAGKVPSDIAVDRTGLYSFAFGQHSLVVTPLQTAVMLGALVNGGRVLKPKVVLLEAGKEVVNTPVSIKREIPMPKQVFDLIYRGMQRVTAHIFEEGMRSLQRIYRTQPAAIEAFVEMKDRLIGKTGSAEVMEHLSMDLQRGTQKMTHVWFGGVAYDDNKMPELVIVVFLKYGAHGKDAAPLTAQIAKKWREIKQKHGVN